jgi:hypothetical protein
LISIGCGLAFSMIVSGTLGAKKDSVDDAVWRGAPAVNDPRTSASQWIQVKNPSQWAVWPDHHSNPPCTA